MRSSDYKATSGKNRKVSVKHCKPMVEAVLRGLDDRFKYISVKSCLCRRETTIALKGKALSGRFERTVVLMAYILGVHP